MLLSNPYYPVGCITINIPFNIDKYTSIFGYFQSVSIDKNLNRKIKNLVVF